MLPNCRTFSIVAFIGFAANWQFGYQITYINTAAESFYDFANIAYEANHNGTSLDRQVWSTEWSWIVASFYPGTFLGFVSVPFLIRRVGIRKSLLYSTYPAVLGLCLSLLVRFSASSRELFFVLNLAIGRFLVGIQAGCSLCLLPLFIIEASPPANRPFLSSLQQVFQALSTLIGFLLGSDSILWLGKNKIEWLQIFGLLPMCAFIIFVMYLPETPLYILEKQDEEELKKFMNEAQELGMENMPESKLNQSVKFYFADLKYLPEIQEEAFERWTVDLTESELGSLRKKANCKALIIGSIAAISSAFTADDIIDAFSSPLLKRTSGENSSLPEIITIGLGVWLFITSVGGAYLIDRFGRKKLLIIGLIGTAISNAIAATGSAFDSVIFVTLGFAFTKSFIGFGAGAPAWFLTSELVSPRVTCTAQSISTGCLLIMVGFVTLFFLQVELQIGGTLAILLLSTLPALAIAILLILFLPETMNHTHAQISNLITSSFFSGLGTERKLSQHQHRPSFQRMLSAKSYVSYGSTTRNSSFHLDNEQAIRQANKLKVPNGNPGTINF